MEFIDKSLSVIKNGLEFYLFFFQETEWLASKCQRQKKNKKIYFQNIDKVTRKKQNYQTQDFLKTNEFFCSMQLSHSKEKLFNDLHPTLEQTVQFRRPQIITFQKGIFSMLPLQLCSGELWQRLGDENSRTNQLRTTPPKTPSNYPKMSQHYQRSIAWPPVSCEIHSAHRLWPSLNATRSIRSSCVPPRSSATVDAACGG